MSGLALSGQQEWMPDGVLKVVERFPAGARLLADRGMQTVWETLRAKGLQRASNDPEEFERRLSNLPDEYRKETFDGTPPGGEPDIEWLPSIMGEGNVSADELDQTYGRHMRDSRVAYLAESACASFFLAAAIIFTRGIRTVREQDLKQEAQRWRTGAALCREACLGMHRARLDHDLAEALSTSAAYFDEHADSIGTAPGSDFYIVERRGLERAPGANRGSTGDEDVRGQVGHLAWAAKLIFGSFLHKPVAITASVATGVTISPKSVENWSRSLELFS